MVQNSGTLTFLIHGYLLNTGTYSLTRGIIRKPCIRCPSLAVTEFETLATRVKLCVNDQKFKAHLLLRTLPPSMDNTVDNLLMGLWGPSI